MHKVINVKHFLTGKEDDYKIQSNTLQSESQG